MATKLKERIIKLFFTKHASVRKIRAIILKNLNSMLKSWNKRNRKPAQKGRDLYLYTGGRGE